MSVKRVIVLVVFCFLFFLGVYTWNERTGKVDVLGTNLGLEVVGVVLRVVTNTHDSITNMWNGYWDLVDAQKENQQLKQTIDVLTLEMAKAKEDQRELARLRALYSFRPPMDWELVGASLLAWRLGSNDFLETFVLSKGYLNGAKPGTPIIVPEGLMGRVFKAGPYTSIALLLTDPGSSVAVVSADNRVPGVIQGNGAGKMLSMQFVKQNQTVAVGELLVTSGVDLSYPKGIPVAKIVSVDYGPNAMFTIEAEPLVAFEKNEEVLLLKNPYEQFLPQSSPIYSPRTNRFFTQTQELETLGGTVRSEGYSSLTSLESVTTGTSEENGRQERTDEMGVDVDTLPNPKKNNTQAPNREPVRSE